MTEVILNVHTLKAKVHFNQIEAGTFFSATKVGEVHTADAILFRSGMGIHLVSGPGQGTTPAIYTDDKWIHDYRPIKLVRMEFAKD